MGFLMGAYGKLMAGQRMRNIQFQLTTVQSRLRRITKEIGLKEKMYQSQERNMKTQLQNQMYAGMYTELANTPGMEQYAQLMMGTMMGMSMSNPSLLQGLNTQQSSTYAMIQQNYQMMFMQSQNMWQNMFEMQKEADLQALKDVEEDLQIEKDNLESQLKIAQADYEANKEMEKQGAQNLKPDYTGQA